MLPRLALALALAALALPPEATAAFLAGEPEPAARIVVGVWLFKGMLALHALLAATAPRWWGPSREPERQAPGAALPAALPGAATRTLRDPWLLAILAGGLGLRLVDLGAGLWFDEIHTLVEYVRRPLGHILTTFDSLNQHLVYTVSAWTARTLLGDGAVSLRLPAVIFGLGSLGAVAWLGRLTTGRLQGLLAAALLAASYHHVWFSQNARGYTALLLWTVVGTGLFWRSSTDASTDASTGAAASRPGDPLAYAGVMALALLTHLSAGFVLATHALLWAGTAWRRRPGAELTRSRWAVAFLLAGTLALQGYSLGLPQLAGVVGETLAPAVGLEGAPAEEASADSRTPAASSEPVEWQTPLWFVRETLDGLRRGLPGGWLALAAGALVGLAGLIAGWRRQPLLVLAMYLPAVTTAAVLLAAERNLWPRFFFFAFGFLALTGVEGIFALAARLPRGWRVWTAATATLLAVAASATTVPRAWGPKQDWEGARRFVERHASGPVAGAEMAGYVGDEYLHAGWIRVDSAAELDTLESEAGAPPWIVYSFPTRLRDVAPELARRLAEGAGYRAAAVFPGTLGGGEIIVARPDGAVDEEESEEPMAGERGMDGAGAAELAGDPAS